MREGRARRLIVNVPPRHLKSLAASIALPAWLLGHDPTLAIVNVTYAQDLSDTFARDCRAVMASAWYRALFPTRLASPRGRRCASSIDDERRVPAGDLGRRGADRARRRRDPDRRSAEARRRDVGKPPHGRQRLVRRHALFAAQRQDEGLDRHRDAAPARGRSRRPCARGRRAGRSSSFPAIAEADEAHEVETTFGPQGVLRARPAKRCMRSASRWRRSSASARRSAK